jgi:uncharacterized protein (DUF58 family)
VPDPDILRQVKLLELRTRGLVNSVFTGEYHSVFKGQGMEFAEVREYQPGDEVRAIDWNVTARMRHPYVKRYVEERELPVWLAVDLAGSARFGTVARFKSELATELSLVLAMAAIRNNDRVGVLLFTDMVEHVVPPAKGRKHVLRLVRDILSWEPEGRGTSIEAATDALARMHPHRSNEFNVTDIVEPGIERPLKILSPRHQGVDRGLLGEGAVGRCPQLARVDRFHREAAVGSRREGDLRAARRTHAHQHLEVLAHRHGVRPHEHAHLHALRSGVGCRCGGQRVLPRREERERGDEEWHYHRRRILVSLPRKKRRSASV